MIGEMFGLYLESLLAFWQGLARSGYVHLMIIGLLVWWLVCRRGRACCGCRRCGCTCGCCRCEQDEST